MDMTIVNLKKGPFGNVLAFFDVAIDDTFLLQGFALKKKVDGSAYYWQSPSKPRQKPAQVTIAGEQVKVYVPQRDSKDGREFDIYDDIVKLHFDEATDKPTEAAWAGKKHLTELAVAAYEAAATPAKGPGRGAAKPAGTARPPAMATSVEDADDDEEPLPF